MAEGRTRRASAAGRETKTKAQEEFSKYKERTAPTGPTAGPRIAIPQPQGGMPSWPVPPAFVMAPAGPGQPPADGGPAGPGPGLVSAAEGLGTSIRLGVDVLNAALASGVRLLGGVSMVAESLGGYTVEGAGYGGCSCAECHQAYGAHTRDDACCGPALGCDCDASVGSCW